MEASPLTEALVTGRWYGFRRMWLVEWQCTEQGVGSAAARKPGKLAASLMGSLRRLAWSPANPF